MREFRLINRPDFWAAVVGLVSVVALSLFGVEMDQEAILAGILAIVGIFTGSTAMSEYRAQRLEEEKVKAQAQVQRAQAEVEVAKAYAPTVKATPQLAEE